MRFFRKEKNFFPRAKSYDFTLRIPKIVKSEAALQHKGSMLVEAEQCLPGVHTMTESRTRSLNREGNLLVAQ